MITIHHLENSRSLRVIWLLEELGLDYEVKRYQRDTVTNLAPDAYKALHPVGKAPIITVDDSAIAETGAIIEYLMDRHPEAGLRPEAGDAMRDRYHYWMHASEGSLMPLLVMSLFFTRMETVPPFFIRPIVKMVTGRIRDMYLTPSTTTMLDYIEAELGKSDWFAGDKMTAADIMMSFPVEAAMARVAGGRAMPNTQAWLERIHARPAYQVAVKMGGEQEILT